MLLATGGWTGWEWKTNSKGSICQKLPSLLASFKHHVLITWIVCISSQVVTTVIATSSWSRSSRMHNHRRKSKKWKIIVYVQQWHFTITHSSQHFVTVGSHIFEQQVIVSRKLIHDRSDFPYKLNQAISLPTLAVFTAVVVHSKTPDKMFVLDQACLLQLWLFLLQFSV